jgi:leucyl/phenylalanyl-tRNA--protein transferase
MPRKPYQGTWITKEMREAYVRLHELGYAHSVEVWDPRDKKLVGGLYGVSLGKCFFGESMFHIVPNASKYGFVIFIQKLFKIGFLMVDGQVPSPHLKKLGCREMPRKEFLDLLAEDLEHKTRVGKWEFLKDV